MNSTSSSSKSLDLSCVSIIIPALNEAENLAILIPHLQSLAPGQILICDNGSTDKTKSVVERLGVQRVFEPRRGYGSACFAGMKQLSPDCDIVVFMDADLSDDVSKLPDLVKPILNDEFDLVMGARLISLRESGSTTFPQRVANILFPMLMKVGWGHAFQDMGPLRAIRRNSLDAIDMKDRAFGWTIEMQIRAVELGLRILEIPVISRKRSRGKSKISGNWIGTLRAAYWIIRTCVTLWVTKRRRMKQHLSVGV